MITGFQRWLFGGLLVIAAFPVFAERVANQTLRLPLELGGTNYSTERVTALGQTYALFPRTPPGETNRLFLGFKIGAIQVITNLAAPTITEFLDLRKQTVTESESGLVGFAFHPGFATNHYFYVYYALRADGPEGPLYQRLSRFQVNPASPNEVLPGSELPLFTQLDPDYDHNGGDLVFGPDGYLYVTVGDGGGAYDQFGNSQHIDGGFFGGILRLDVDRRPGSLSPNPHPSVHPFTYAIPPDNPFVGATSFNGQPVDPTQVRTEFYAVGLRNPFRICFDPVTDELWANDVGQNLKEEIDLIRPGANYGWPYFEASLPGPKESPGGQFEPPLYEYWHERGRVAITGSLLYRGTRFPEFDGAYLFADLSGSIDVLRRLPDGPQVSWLTTLPLVVELTVHPSTGDILITGPQDGYIHRLVKHVNDGPPVPEKLSQTGIFADTATLRPNPGIVPYQVKLPFWSDDASKQRWFCLPDVRQTFEFQRTKSWGFPVGSVWIKHFEVPGPRIGDPPRRLETRVLVRNSTGVWGGTYRWDDEQVDAILVPAEGFDEAVQIFQEGELRTKTWRYPSRAECLQCHTAAAGYALGFNTAQLNVSWAGPGPGSNPISQLAALAANGYFRERLPAIETLPQLAALDDERWPRSYRVRSYLAANCAYCHQHEGGTRTFWDGRLDLNFEETRLANGDPAVISLATGSEDLPTYVVAPGDLRRSSLFRRVAELAPHHMPPLATFALNTTAVDLLSAWITEDLPTRRNYAAFRLETLGELPDALGAPDQDPDGDGLSNAAEHLLGEDPLNAERRWRPQLARHDGNLVIRFERRAGLRFEVQWTPSLDLPTWELVDDPANRWTVGQDDEEVEVPLPFGEGGGFCRIMIQEP